MSEALKCIVMSDDPKGVLYWHPFLHQWQSTPVRIQEAWAEQYFEECIDKHPKRLIDLVDA